MIKKIILVIVSLLFLVLVVGALLLRHAYKTGFLQEAVVNKVTEEISARSVSSTPVAVAEQANFIKKILGFSAPQTYLVLLLNNTELRPGGGFIGSYALVQVDKGIPHIQKVEGTEILDYSGYPEDFPSIPPDALKTYLKVPRWYFRDANWSPDFASSAVKALDLYKKERGVGADAISGVIGITATTLEEILAITGPITVQGETFTSANVVDKLEYEVEIAFAQKGVDRAERKQILSALVKAVAQKMATDVFAHWQQYFALGQRLLSEKSVMMYSLDPVDQTVLSTKRWAGSIMPYPGGDYLLWVDANLGALKTDAVLKRSLTYTIAPSGTTFIGTATMRYAHGGGRDWKTSRYLTYLRVYLPPGTRLLSAQGIEKNALGMSTSTPDRGVEFDRQWFGGFASIDPGTIGQVSFTFELTPSVVRMVRDGMYYALFEKQLGTRDQALTLHFDFGRKVLSANPGEVPAEYGDNRYHIESNLETDRYVEVKLETAK